jgi:hypothetical protein
MIAREVKVSASERGLKLQSNLYHYSNFARGRRLALNLRFVALVLDEGPSIEVFEKLNKENRVRVDVPWEEAPSKPIDLSVEDICISEDDDLLFSVTNKGKDRIGI